MLDRMEKGGALREVYGQERMNAEAAQRLAHSIAFGPVAFQVSRLMLKFGIFERLPLSGEGVSCLEIASGMGLSTYAAQVLLEASVSIGTVLMREEKYFLSKAGWFILHDPLVRVNMDFNHDVNYQGMFYLEEALREGKPAGLRVFGDWDTIYEGLSQLPQQVQASWFRFDHFYSDASFPAALRVVFDGERSVRHLLDVGGNTGRWALRCVAYNAAVEVTIVDLPQQLETMRAQVAGHDGAERIHGFACNLLDEGAAFPSGAYDAIWMSQFLDCFSEGEVTSICRRAAEAMGPDTRLYIMETFWDRQQYETAAYCLTLTSLYFTAMANGNSKMYRSDDMVRCVEAAGLEVESMVDGLGLGHTIMVCRRRYE